MNIRTSILVLVLLAALPELSGALDNPSHLPLDLKGVEPFRFVLLGDLHVTDLDDDDLFMRQLVDELNGLAGIDFILDAGDVLDPIVEGDPATSERTLALYQNHISRSKVPWHVVKGNHDFKISDAQWTQYFGNPGRFVFRHKNVWFVAFNTGIETWYDLKVAQTELDWIAQVLQDIPQDEPIIALTHYPLGYGIPNPHYYGIHNRDELLGLFADHNLIAFLAGHYHGGGCMIKDDLLCYTTKSISINRNPKHDEETYAVFTVSGQGLSWEAIPYTQHKSLKKMFIPSDQTPVYLEGHGWSKPTQLCGRSCRGSFAREGYGCRPAFFILPNKDTDHVKLEVDVLCDHQATIEIWVDYWDGGGQFDYKMGDIKLTDDNSWKTYQFDIDLVTDVYEKDRNLWENKPVTFVFWDSEAQKLTHAIFVSRISFIDRSKHILNVGNESGNMLNPCDEEITE